MRKKTVALSFLLTLSACSVDDYNKLSKLPSASSVPVEYQKDVAFIKEMRKFGIEKLGLYKNSAHYTTFSNTEEEARIFYRLFVAKPTVLPDSWGEALKFFENHTVFREEVDAMYFISFVDNLEDESIYFNKKGYDVFSRNTTNYNPVNSSLGSSITPSFLKYSKEWQANTILHEICHDSLEEWIGQNFASELDESFCSLVGFAGAAEFFRSREGASSPEYKDASASFNRYESRSLEVAKAYKELQRLYQDEISFSEKIRQRELIFAEAKEKLGEEVNNAKLWDIYPYTKYYPLMLQLYRSLNNDLRQTLEVMKDCPEDTEKALSFIKNNIKN